MKSMTKSIEQKSEGTIGARIKKELKRNYCVYIMAIPVIVYFLLFCYGPMFGVVIAFKQYDMAKGILASKWVGLKYFIEYFQSEYFVRTVRNTLLISFYDIIIGFPIPIIFALMLNEIVNVKFKKLVQNVTYLPHFISMVVMCGIISDFFATEGAATRLIAALGGEKVNYLGLAKYFRRIFVGTNIWQAFGWESIIYLAALTGVDKQLYEAAEIDGAGRFKQLIHVTLPGIIPTIVIMLIMRIGQVMSVGYEKIILLYGPSTYETADVISSFVYRRGLGETMQYSYSTAVGLFQSVINLIFLITTNAISKKLSDTSLF